MFDRLKHFYIDDFKKNPLGCLILLIIAIMIFYDDYKGRPLSHYFSYFILVSIMYVVTRGIVYFAHADFVLGFLPSLMYFFGSDWITDRYNQHINFTGLALVIGSLVLFEINQKRINDGSYKTNVYNQKVTKAGMIWVIPSILVAVFFFILCKIGRPTALVATVVPILSILGIIISFRYSIARAVIKYFVLLGFVGWFFNWLTAIIFGKGLLSAGAAGTGIAGAAGAAGDSDAGSLLFDSNNELSIDSEGVSSIGGSLPLNGNSTIDVSPLDSNLTNAASESTLPIISGVSLGASDIIPFTFDSTGIVEQSAFPIDPNIVLQSISDPSIGATYVDVGANGIDAMKICNGQIFGTNGMVIGSYEDTATGTAFYDKVHKLIFTVTDSGNYVKPDGTVFANIDNKLNLVSAVGLASNISLDKTGGILKNGVLVGKITH